MASASNASRGPGSKFLLTIIPGLVASGVAASVLYAIHVSRAPAVSEYLSEPTAHSDGLSAEERRDLTRQMLKERRENPEQPAQVQQPRATPEDPMDGDGTAAANAAGGDARITDAARVPDAAKAVPGGADLPINVPSVPDTARVPDPVAPGAAGADVKAADAKPDVKPADGRPVDVRPADAARPQGGVVVRVAPDKPPAVATAPLPPVRPSVRPRPEPPASASAAPLPPAMAAAPAGPTQLSPGARGTQPGGVPPPPAQAVAPPVQAAGAPPPPEAEQRGFASNVLSGLSSVAGSAANATGSAANWVIDLPGKAINAGGKLIGIKRDAAQDPAAPPPAGAPPPPAGAVDPKRNL